MSAICAPGSVSPIWLTLVALHFDSGGAALVCGQAQIVEKLGIFGVKSGGLGIDYERHHDAVHGPVRVIDKAIGGGGCAGPDDV